MEMIYRSKFTSNKFETYIIYGLGLFIIFADVVILFFTNHMLRYKVLSSLLLTLLLGLPCLILIILWNIKIIVKDDELIWKRIDKTVAVKWDEVKKVQRLWRPNAGICYDIITTKGRLNIPRNIENYEDLFKEIKNHTGKSVKWGI